MSYYLWYFTEKDPLAGFMFTVFLLVVFLVGSFIYSQWKHD